MGEDQVSRRQMIAAAGVGAVVLAGCTEDTTGNETGGGGGSAQLQPPVPPSGEPDNEYWRFMIDSMEYQNEMMQQLAEEI